MLEGLKGMAITFKETFKKPVTAQYPKEHMPIAPRFMGFPVLTFDFDTSEPFCVACMVCIRNCPTQCMTATMMDNPKFKDGTSPRRKMVESFTINYSRCIVCNICVEMCNFDAIAMSHEHEMSNPLRDGRRQDLPALLELGKTYQQASDWEPSTKKRGARVTAAAKGAEAAGPAKPAGDAAVLASAPAAGAASTARQIPIRPSRGVSPPSPIAPTAPAGEVAPSTPPAPPQAKAEDTPPQTPPALKEQA